jgi:phosphatidate cytidylyltransferase
VSDAPQTAGPKPDSDFTVRFVVGVLLIAGASLVTWAGGWWFRALAVIAVGLMLIEWADLKKVPRLWGGIAAVLAAGVLLGAAEYYYPVSADAAELVEISFVPALAGALLIGLVTLRIAMGWGFAYIVLPAYCLVVLNWIEAGLVFWVIIVTVATDTFAYFAGRGIGGPKLAPKLSPNKTWAGLVGGMAGASCFGWLAAWYFELGAPFLWLGAAMGLVAQAGDLYESWEKRRAGVKDSGTLLPGHGGVLDRLDGLLAVSLAVMAILLWTQLWDPPAPPDDGLIETMTARHETGARAG